MMMTLFDDEYVLEAYVKDIADNAALRVARETAERMIRKGKLPLEEIADYVPALSLDDLRKIESEVMQLA
ncbi:MAG: hypothetical protein NC548_43430 [Lachnospiraceae bacterium]|nr:hypothetical protein [Lachnospiraceae bacterium]